jgi:membrane fusion protein (multidrug efflux system)
VVVDGNKVERRRLQLARAVGNQWLVTSGLMAGDRLIVEGLQRARAGQTVTPVAAAGASAPKVRHGSAASAASEPRAEAASHGLVLHRPAHLRVGAGDRHHAGWCSPRH